MLRYSITSMVRQRGRETQIQVYEPHHCYITESWKIIKMERMYMCKGWMLKCCWDCHKRHHALHKATVQCGTLQYNIINSLRAKFISWTNKCICHRTGMMISIKYESWHIDSSYILQTDYHLYECASRLAITSPYQCSITNVAISNSAYTIIL